MLITPRPGAHRDNILSALREVHTSAMNARSAGPSNAYRRLLNYLEWATDAARRLRSQVSEADLDHLIFTRRHAALLDGVGHLAGTEQQRLVNGLVDQELHERERDLAEAAMALQNQIDRWGGQAIFVIADTSFYIQHPIKFDHVDYPELLSTVPYDGVHLVLPIVVVDELDRLKEGKQQARWRSSYTLGVLDNILEDSGAGTLRPRDPKTTTGGICGAITTEIVFDPPGHARLPIADDEIIDRALAIQALAGRRVRILTYDTGQATRARAAGLPVKKLRGDAGTGEEPDWAALEAAQTKGTGGTRQARRERKTAEAAARDGAAAADTRRRDGQRPS
ncbi:PIN domain-containing protein [Streptomyces sp.]|uniref:PIN domain-containing protein n=1 Tax=Streptomyces sp. TaxID=1931 RepID=UPI002F410521